MRTLALILVELALVYPATAAEPPRPTGDAIVSPDAKLELLFTRSAPIKGGLTEGPAVAPDGSIYFSDIPFGSDKGMIHRFDPKTRKTTVFAEDSHKSNGLHFDAAGGLIACEGSDEGGRCVSRWDVKSGKREVLADKYMGKRFNACNDLVIDRKGRIYFTDPRYLGAEPRELDHRAVYRLNPPEGAASVLEVTHEVSKPNGIGLSPDEKTLYVADHDNGTDKIGSVEKPTKGPMKVYAFPLGDDGLVKGPRKTLVDFGAEDGCDGMTLDQDGNIYLAVRSLKRPGVMVIDPNGKEIAYIPTGPAGQQEGKDPVGLPSNCTFGVGTENSVLYVTVDKSLYRIPLKAKGIRQPFEKE